MLRIPINKEIREYKETMIWGLTLRQTVFSALATAAAVLSYLYLGSVLGDELRSWVCVLAAAPFALLGYYKYNGMPAEKVLMAWLRSTVQTPKALLFKPTNIWMEVCADSIEKATKEEIPYYD